MLIHQRLRLLAPWTGDDAPAADVLRMTLHRLIETSTEKRLLARRTGALNGTTVVSPFPVAQ